jgi:hypothetical protein
VRKREFLKESAKAQGSRQRFKLHYILSSRPEQVPVSVCWKRELVRAKGLNFTADAISDRNKFRFPRLENLNFNATSHLQEYLEA